jgi:glycosyltransferase involved in cell wall biosynthesis
MKLLIVNDYHPIDYPGAASVAWDLAEMLLNTGLEVEYWTGNLQSAKKTLFSELVIRQFRLPTNVLKLRRLEILRHFYREFGNFRNTVKLACTLHKVKPDLVWVHQTGNVFPRTLVLLCRLFKIRSLITLHDFNYIALRKLLPADLLLTPPEIRELHQTNSKEDLSKYIFRNRHNLVSLFLKMRISLNRFLLAQFDKVICISQMQANIYQSLNFRIDEVIPNRIDACSCDSFAKERERSALIVGRMAEKGFPDALSSITRYKYKFHLVGKEFLSLKNSLDEAECDYNLYGQLEPQDVHKIMHKVRFVFVLSTCFDVYPTVALEAMAHGAIPLVSWTTGTSGYLSSVLPELIYFTGNPPNLDSLWEQQFRISSILNQFSQSRVVDRRANLNSYLKNILN